MCTRCILQHLFSDNISSGHAGILLLPLPVYHRVALNLDKLAKWHHSSLPSFPKEISSSLCSSVHLTSLPNPLHHSTTTAWSRRRAQKEKKSSQRQAQKKSTLATMQKKSRSSSQGRQSCLRFRCHHYLCSTAGKPGISPITATAPVDFLKVITVALKGNAIEAFWAGTSFLLTSMVWQPNFAAFSHLWGRRPLLLVALTFFTVGSIVCALSKNFTMMLVGRLYKVLAGRHNCPHGIPHHRHGAPPRARELLCSHQHRLGDRQRSRSSGWRRPGPSRCLALDLLSQSTNRGRRLRGHHCLPQT